MLAQKPGIAVPAQNLYTLLFRFQDGASASEAAVEAGLGLSTGKRYLAMGDFASYARQGSQKKPRRAITEQDGEIIAGLHYSGYDAGRIGNLLGYNRSTISGWLKEHKMRARIGTPKVIEQKRIERLLGLYLDEGESVEEAAEGSGMCRHSATKYLRKYRVQTGRWTRDIVVDGVLVSRAEHFERLREG